MRLLNIHTLELQDFTAREIPSYCILSHRWTNDEVSHKEYRKGLKKHSVGYQKIVDFCVFLRTRPHCFSRTDFELECREGLLEQETVVNWAWIDTCCIDKRSSAELSEAINSMFQWYCEARECYVYLTDVELPPLIPPFNLLSDEKAKLVAQFHQSNWFERGWTLQELIAPRAVVFCNAHWDVIGHHKQKSVRKPHDLTNDLYDLACGLDLTKEVSEISGIATVYLKRSKPLKRASIAQRMSWAAKRSTTRPEDEAYCLLGIFGINMPLLYGEGRKAFFRLQEELIRHSTDMSVLAWDSCHLRGTHGVLARSPRWFAGVGGKDELCHIPGETASTTNHGLQLRTVLSYYAADKFVLSLNYAMQDRKPVQILLSMTTKYATFFRDPENLDPSKVRPVKKKDTYLIYLSTDQEIVSMDQPPEHVDDHHEDRFLEH